MVRCQQPNHMGQIEERVIAVRVGKKQMGVLSTYKQLAGKPVSVPVFPALWKHRKGFNWQLRAAASLLLSLLLSLFRPRAKVRAPT